MKQPIGLDRRRFVQMVGGTSLLGAVAGRFRWAASRGAATLAAKLVYIGAENEIHVYSIAADGRFLKQQAIASAHPVAMAISRGNLFVANGVSEYGSLPRGSVQAYAIDGATGHLALKNRVPLSLSGILPRDLAIAPDGRSVVVAVHGGGAYNALSVDEEGRLGRVSWILKETGSGPHAWQACAHPAAVMFDPVGRVLTADQGSDQLSVLSISHGELTVVGRCEVTAGSGPSSMVLDPNGKRLYVAHALNGSVSSFGYDPTVGRILDRKQAVSASVAGEMAALAMHPSGEMLYSSHGDGIQAWKIAANSALEGSPGVEGVCANKLHVTADGKSLLALSSDAVLQMNIDRATHVLAAPVNLVSLSKPLSIAVWYQKPGVFTSN
ncbi:MAG TPA: beta-propeller fold lactonase family protein [Terriglobales bacterium]|nr:beta-propeller fold lactonase family protein [Terriglobales bacterium]